MLATQVQYWANQEQKRHNLTMEEIGRFDSQTKRIESDTNKFKAATDRYAVETGRLNYEISSINALTSQTEAATRQAAQKTNEQRLVYDYAKLAQDYELGLLSNKVASKQAQASAVQAQAAMSQAGSRRDEVDANVNYTESKTVGQNISNTYGHVREITNAAQSITKSLDNLGITGNAIAKTAKSIGQGFGYLINNR